MALLAFTSTVSAQSNANDTVISWGKSTPHYACPTWYLQRSEFPHILDSIGFYVHTPTGEVNLPINSFVVGWQVGKGGFIEEKCPGHKISPQLQKAVDNRQMSTLYIDQFKVANAPNTNVLLGTKNQMKIIILEDNYQVKLNAGQVVGAQELTIKRSEVLKIADSITCEGTEGGKKINLAIESFNLGYTSVKDGRSSYSEFDSKTGTFTREIKDGLANLVDKPYATKLFITDVRVATPDGKLFYAPGLKIKILD